MFVDTSVWSLALRRDEPASSPETEALKRALEIGSVVTTGLVLQELLQGFPKPQAHAQITALFAALPMLVPNRDDHVRAAEIRNLCRRKGIQVGTIDALFAQLCVHHGLPMLTTDRDFDRVAELAQMPLWKNPSG
jgi:predicted nucleic acid-binding protein